MFLKIWYLKELILILPIKNNKKDDYDDDSIIQYHILIYEDWIFN